MRRAPGHLRATPSPTATIFPVAATPSCACLTNFKDVHVEFHKPPTPKVQTPISPAVGVQFVALVPADIPTPLQPPKANEAHMQPIIPAL